jgi:cysteinyl-tRNA synthetase
MRRQKEEFIPREVGKVSIYACGPTVYNYFHLGNARMLVVFDMIRRYFAWRGYEVTYVQNFTDVDDKIIAKAREEGVAPQALAERYITEYFKDAAALDILPATVHPRATAHIDEMQELIRSLLAKNLAYANDGDVYFAVTRYEAYGRLSGRVLDDLQAGARVEIDAKKENPLDFALWKKSNPDEIGWDSPWGRGRPGWHIECSAMSLKYLGAGFDIHGGGNDLIFPHHENEIAQTEGHLDGGVMARYWLHNAFIMINEEKMSKSLGNFFLVREVLVKFPGDVLRFYLLSTHYRSPLNFDDEKLTMAAKGLERLKTAVRLTKERLAQLGEAVDSATGGELSAAATLARTAFTLAMDDDFNSAQATAALFDLAHSLNASDETQGLQEALSTLLELAGVLGFDLNRQAQAGETELLDKVMTLVLTLRERARVGKDWATADFLRDELTNIGIKVEDTPDGARWRPLD